ncbi:hypothetical protein [Nonomuraea sp. SBT364]|uniref:hypothetical protein n=1 Tax=Nonomuraea sp. SBT364 TaxID=1580530 RepID=UPI00066CAD1E|nr:hypothetical protein [Nonomuraea sp. SBT364]
MAFTPCTSGTVALYTVDDETLLAVPVEAWDEQGVAHIAGIKGLIQADTRPGFLRLEQASQPLPAPGRPVREPVRVGPPPGRRPGPRDPTDPRGPRPDPPRGRQP